MLSQSHLHSRLVLSVVASSALLALLLLFVLGTTRNQALEQGTARAVGTAEVLNANLSGIIAKVDIALQSVADEATRQSAAGGLDKPAFDRFIVRTHQRLPEIATFRAANAEGLAIYGAEVTVANTRSLAHRNYYKTLRDENRTTLVFSEPLVGGITGKWMILFVRRINDAQGKFAGLVYAGVTLDYLTQAFAAFPVGADGSIALLDHQLGMIDQLPHLEDPATAIGIRSADPDLSRFVLEGKQSGNYQSLGRYLTSFIRMGEYPYYLVVRLSEDVVLAEWQQLLVILTLTWLTFLAGAIVGALVFSGQAARNRQAAEELQARELERTLHLKENDLLLNEIHHRIKDNLATVAMLLNLPDKPATNTPEQILKAASTRVRSMALLYDKLQLADNRQELSLKEYLTLLLPEIHRSFPKGESVQLDLQLDDVILPAKKASVLGILLNELMTNAMRHAFVGRTNGLIEVKVTTAEGAVVVEFRDDGVGLQKEDNSAPVEGFGSQLVPMMVRQLRGTRVALPGPGTGFRISFPL